MIAYYLTTPTAKTTKEALFSTPVYADTKCYQFEDLSEDKYGDVGRVYVPSLNIDCPLYKATKNKTKQDVIDDENSALVVAFHGAVDIGDHAGQGFDAIYDVKPGKTLAFVGDQKKGAIYRCIGSLIAVNNSYDEDHHYKDLDGKEIDKNFKGKLIMSTCYDDNNLVFLAVFERVR